MLNRPFPVPLDKQLTLIACLTVWLSGMTFRLGGWIAVVWIGLILSIQILFLAHHVALASPADEELEAQSIVD